MTVAQQQAHEDTPAVRSPATGTPPDATTHTPTPREALAAAWRAVGPKTPKDIARFYALSATAKVLEDDLTAWHAVPERQTWTAMLVHAVAKSNAVQVVDIGCGAGHDLAALYQSQPHLRYLGVEPNHVLRTKAKERVPGSRAVARVEDAPLETADFLVCVDVLEHVPDPEIYLGSIAQRAQVGCWLFETTATHDTGTPLHLAANYGWHPGRVLERHGWQLKDYSGRVRIWRRVNSAGSATASLLLCAYRTVTAETMQAIVGLTAGGHYPWRCRIRHGDALIARSRSIVVSRWWAETNDDVFLMVDDDIVFTPEDAERLREHCRTRRTVVCGAYAVHDGSHLACRFLDNTTDVHFGPGEPLLEIAYAATGFMAVHRAVVDALIAHLPLCHSGDEWSYYPLFLPKVVESPAGSGAHIVLSEDWAFSAAAAAAGFPILLDRQAHLTHLGPAPVTINNMAKMYEAFAAR